MKKTLRFIAALGLGAIWLNSCSRDVDFTDLPFVYFDDATLTVAEDAGRIRIPIHASDKGTFTLSFDIVDGTKVDPVTGQTVPNGKAGEDFTIVDNPAAILNFRSEDVQYIDIDIIDFDGVLTGNKDFTIKLRSAGNEYSLGGFSNLKVTIQDNDHPLKEILGAYEVTAYDYFGGANESWTMTFVADPNDYFRIWIDGITPTFVGHYLSGADGNNHAIYGTFNKIDDVTANLNAITIPAGQKFADTYNDYDILISRISGGGYSNSGNITFNRLSDGSGYSSATGWGANISGTSSFYDLFWDSPAPQIIKK